MKFRKILFTSQFEYEGKVYEKGQIYEITTDRNIAQRFIVRGCVDVTDKELISDIKESLDKAEDFINKETENVEMVNEISSEVSNIENTEIGDVEIEETVEVAPKEIAKEDKKNKRNKKNK